MAGYALELVGDDRIAWSACLREVLEEQGAPEEAVPEESNKLCGAEEAEGSNRKESGKTKAHN